MDNNYLNRIELYCMLIDIVKSLKSKVYTKREIAGLNVIENNLVKLLSLERIV